MSCRAVQHLHVGAKEAFGPCTCTMQSPSRAIGVLCDSIQGWHLSHELRSCLIPQCEEAHSTDAMLTWLHCTAPCCSASLP